MSAAGPVGVGVGVGVGVSACVAVALGVGAVSVSAARGHSTRASATATRASTPTAARIIRVRVEDSGPGVSPEAERKLFVPFASTKPGGTGLGLSLVAKVAALHGGSVAAGRSETLGGAAFRLALPPAPPRGS